MPDELIIPRPTDFHVHLRQGRLLERVAGFTAEVFGAAVVMPNTTPPIVTGDDADRYREEIRQTLTDQSFEPIMTIKLLDHTAPEMIHAARSRGVQAAKLYP